MNVKLTGYGETCYKCKRGEHGLMCASDYCVCCGWPAVEKELPCGHWNKDWKYDQTYDEGRTQGVAQIVWAKCRDCGLVVAPPKMQKEVIP